MGSTIHVSSTRVIINRWVDLIDRAAWTFVEVFLGSLGGISVATGGVHWSATLWSSVFATAGAVAKVMIAQRVGKSPMGDAVPGASAMEVK